MIVLVGNLPPGFSSNHLGDLTRIVSGLHHRILKKHYENGTVYRYGLIYLKSERDGEQLIDALHGHVCQGHTLEVREYRHRAACNERRRLDWRNVPWNGVERRRGERRSSISLRESNARRR